MLVLIIMAFALIAALQVPRLIRQRSWKELAAYSVFLVIAFALNILMAVGVELPNPMLGVKGLFDAIGLHY